MIYCTHCGSGSTWPDEQGGIGYCNACRAQFTFAVQPQVPLPDSTPQAGVPFAVERDARGRARRIVVRMKYGWVYGILTIVPVGFLVFALSFVVRGIVHTGFNPAAVPLLVIPLVMLVFFAGSGLYLALDHVEVELAAGFLRATDGPVPRTKRVEVALASIVALEVAERMHAVDYVELLDQNHPRLPNARGHLVARLRDGSQVDVANFANASTARLIRSELAAALELP